MTNEFLKGSSATGSALKYLKLGEMNPLLGIFLFSPLRQGIQNGTSYNGTAGWVAESEGRNSEGRIDEGEAEWGKEMKSHNEYMGKKKKNGNGK